MKEVLNQAYLTIETFSHSEDFKQIAESFQDDFLALLDDLESAIE